MAKTGLMNPTYAPITSEPENAAIVFGTGKIFACAISASVSFQRSNEKLHGDNKVIDVDNSLTGADVTMGVDDIPEADMVAMLGVEKTGSTGSEEYEDTEVCTPFVGFGYIEVRRKGGVYTYIGNWFRKVQFATPDESTETKKDKTEWQTPTIKGTAIGVVIDNTGTVRFRTRGFFDTYAAALAWLKGKANITPPSEQGA